MSATTTRPVDDPRSQYGSPPERSLAQRFAALERANDIRTRRAELKRDLKAGRKLVSSLLMSPPDYVSTMKVRDLLMAHPQWGRVKVDRALRVCAISPSKHVSGLSERQLRVLTALLGR